MSLEERTKAVARNVEGKVQETVGHLTGDRDEQIKGKAKQVEATARHTKEDIKDAVKRNLDRI